ncbi:Signal transduction histidine kinase [Allopseudospirillum japonicum]|uniref:histidine kinase n=1 Tax=Allopseudospirillum japonicum TaxID=64971 RepID=A0A1H6QHP6_9GAMM|nr:hybrid sensor histidine kinase/response regulator [Allopseudospirillum japonicum]SEI38930.1 Signal transduction histidine kinase [Allopseudospirillum japonicum]
MINLTAWFFRKCWPQPSFRNYLITWFLLISILPLLTLSGVVYLLGKEALLDQQKDYLRALNHSKNQLLQEWDGHLQQILEHIALSKSIRTDFEVYAKQKELQAYQALSQDFIQRVEHYQGNGFFEVFAMNTQGEILISSDKRQQSKLKQNRPYFTEGLKGRYRQNIYHSLTLGEAAMTYSTPLYHVRKENQVLGVISGRIDLNYLNNLTENPNTPHTKTYLVNRYNLIVTQNLAAAPSLLQESTHSEAVHQCLQQKSGIASYVNHQAQMSLGAYQWLPNLELCLLTERPMAQVLAPIHRFAALLVAFVLMLLGLCLPLGWLVAQRLSAAIHALVQATEQITQGQLVDVQVNTHRKDEIGRLARAFNTMVQHIEQHNLHARNQFHELEKSRLQAEQASRSKSEFLATMSHEIRTPMHAILGIIALLQETDPLTDEQKQLLHTGEQAASQLLTLLSDLLDMSRLDAGRMRLLNHPIHLPEMTKEIHSLFNIKAQQKRIELSMILDPQLPEMVLGDSARLRQILINLIDNAIKFTEKGHVVLEIRLLDIGMESVSLFFQVSDTGSGISQSQQRDIFELFQQGDASCSRKHGGTGLGLAIAQGLVRAMGGEIKVDSELGHGSRFNFTLALKCPK